MAGASFWVSSEIFPINEYTKTAKDSKFSLSSKYSWQPKRNKRTYSKILLLPEPKMMIRIEIKDQIGVKIKTQVPKYANVTPITSQNNARYKWQL